jgi:spermidine/putrescine transport system substrate-binding protein
MRILAHEDAVPRLTRRALLGGFTVVGVGALVGCKAPGSGTGSVAQPSTGGSSASGGGTGSASPTPAGPTLDYTGTLQKNLNIYSWGDYDAPGNIKAFIADKGVDVQFDSFNSNEEMIAKLVAAGGHSGYDIVVPTGNFVPQMVANGLLAQINLDLIPNFSNLEAEYKGQYWDPNNQYVVCKDWGTTGFVYDTSKISRDLTSWTDFSDAAQKEASGSTTVLDDPFEFATIFLAAKGYDLNTTDSGQLAEAKDFLVNTLAPNIRKFDSDPSQGLVSSNFTMMQMYNGDCRWALLESKDPGKWKFVYPTPTANLWVDNWAVTSDCAHPDSAMAFINYMLDPDVSYKEMKWNGYPTGLTGQAERAQSAGLNMYDLVFPTQDIIARLTPQKLTEAQTTLVEILNEAKAAAAQ